MMAAKKADKVLDLIIIGETTYRGFIDFSRQTNSFKAYILNSASVNLSNVAFTWQISDSSGKIFADADLVKYKNSVGLLTSSLNMNS